MTGPLLALALAAAPAILLPPWHLSPDGELVAVTGGAALSAEGATVEPAGAGLYRVAPAPGAGRVVLRAAEARTEAEVEPPPGAVEIAIRPAAPVKGKDLSVEVELAVRRADGTPDLEAATPVVGVSTGRVTGLAPAGPGRFRAVFEPAAARYPEVAVLVALVPRCPLCPTPRALGHAIVPLSAAIDLPGHADRGARTSMVVAGRTFGPVTADARGRFAIPIVVPPGARLATATTVDTTGNRRVTEIDLRLPEVDRLACAAWPRAVPADGRSASSVWCIASTPEGAPAAGARLALEAAPGAAGPFETVRGALQRATFTAPAGGGGADAVLRASFPAAGAASRDEVRIALATGAPARIEAAVPREPVGHGATVEAETAVRDARGDLVGRPAGPDGASEGFVAPGRFVARGEGTVQQAPLAFALAPGQEAATLLLGRDRAGWRASLRTVDGRPAAGVPVQFGSGARAVTDARGEARGPAGGARETATAPGGLRAAGWEGFAPAVPPFELSRTVAVALRPPSAVDVRAEAAGGVLRWWVEGADGRPLPGRRVILRSDGVDLGPAEPDGDGGKAAVRGGRGGVAVVDEETGVAALVVVP